MPASELEEYGGLTAGQRLDGLHVLGGRERGVSAKELATTHRCTPAICRLLAEGLQVGEFDFCRKNVGRDGI